MKIASVYLLGILLTLSACSLPNQDNAIAQMDRYWSLFDQKQYDSLKQFYINTNTTSKDSQIFEKFKSFNERFGDPTEARLVKTSTTTSFTEKSVQLDYNIIYQNAIIVQHFIFKEQNREYKIAEHWIDN